MMLTSATSLGALTVNNFQACSHPHVVVSISLGATGPSCGVLPRYY